MAKKYYHQVNFRCSDKELEQLQLLAGAAGEDKAVVLRRLIRERYELMRSNAAAFSALEKREAVDAA